MTDKDEYLVFYEPLDLHYQVWTVTKDLDVDIVQRCITKQAAIDHIENVLEGIYVDADDIVAEFDETPPLEDDWDEDDDA